MDRTKVVGAHEPFYARSALDSPPRSRVRLADAALVVLVLAVAAANAWRFLGSVCDDAVISFRSVDNFASGLGLVFNPGERLETFTNLGLVLLLVAARSLGADVFAAATAIGFTAALAAVAATWWLARELGLGRAAVWPTLFAAATTTLVGQAGSGLETTLCAAFVVSGVARVLQECRERDDGRPRRHGVGMVLLALAVLVRPDSALVLGGMFVLKRALLAPGRRAVAFVVDAVVATVLVGAQVAFRFVYYGELAPNPVYAKVGTTIDPNLVKSGLNYLFEWTRSDFGVAVLVGGLALAFATNSRARALAVLCGGWCLYVVTSGGDHMPYSRFFAPMLGVFAVTVAVGFAPLFVGSRLRTCAGLAFGLALVVQPVWTSVSRGNVPAKNMVHETYRREIGEWFRHEAEARGGGLVVAINPVGYIGYFAGPGVRVVDMLGLCDAHIAKNGHRDSRLLVGHQVGDGAYVLAQRPDYIVLGSTTPGDQWQKRDAAALLAEVRASGIDAWQRANDWQLLVSEREMLATDDLYRDYEAVKITLSSGRTLQMLRRRSR